jgi:hypothetical protein
MSLWPVWCPIVAGRWPCRGIAIPCRLACHPSVKPRRALAETAENSKPHHPDRWRAIRTARRSRRRSIQGHNGRTRARAPRSLRVRHLRRAAQRSFTPSGRLLRPGGRKDVRLGVSIHARASAGSGRRRRTRRPRPRTRRTGRLRWRRASWLAAHQRREPPAPAWIGRHGRSSRESRPVRAVRSCWPPCGPPTAWLACGRAAGPGATAAPDGPLDA